MLALAHRQEGYALVVVQMENGQITSAQSFSDLGLALNDGCTITYQSTNATHKNGRFYLSCGSETWEFQLWKDWFVAGYDGGSGPIIRWGNMGVFYLDDTFRYVDASTYWPACVCTFLLPSGGSQLLPQNRGGADPPCPKQLSALSGLGRDQRSTAAKRAYFPFPMSGPAGQCCAGPGHHPTARQGRTLVQCAGGQSHRLGQRALCAPDERAARRIRLAPVLRLKAGRNSSPRQPV